MSESKTIIFPAELNVKSVREVKAGIDAILHQAGEISMSTGEIREIDTAGVQFLVALFKYCKDKSVSLSCEAFPECVYEFTQAIGIARATLSL